MITRRHVHLNQAWKTPQFRFIWLLLCMSVSVGIGVISMVSPMLQDAFGAKPIGADPAAGLSTEQRTAIVAAAAGLVGLSSLFNSVGRLVWSTSRARRRRRAGRSVWSRSRRGWR